MLMESHGGLKENGHKFIPDFMRGWWELDS